MISRVKSLAPGLKLSELRPKMESAQGDPENQRLMALSTDCSGAASSHG